MQRRGVCFQADAELPALPHDFRRFHRHLRHRRRYQPVARLAHGFQRPGDLVVLRFRRDQLLHQAQQVLIAVDFCAAFLTQNAVEHSVLHRQRQVDSPLAGPKLFQLHAIQLAARREHRRQQVRLAHPVRLLPRLLQPRQHFLHEIMPFVERFQPLRDAQAHLPHGEFQQHGFQHLLHVRALHVLHAHQHDRHAIRLLQISTQRLRIGAVRHSGIEDDDERLAQRFQLADDAVFRLDVGAARQFGDCTVRRHDDADGRVVSHHLARTDFRRLFEGNIMVIPRRMHHAAAGFVHRTECAAHHVAHAVHQPDAHRGVVAQADRDGLAGHKLRLRRHDGSARPALRQLIRNALFARAFGDFGHHQQFHQAADKGAFARPHRPYNAQIHVAVGALGNIAIQIKRRAFHFCPSSASLAPPYERGMDFILFF